MRHSLKCYGRSVALGCFVAGAATTGSHAQTCTVVFSPSQLPAGCTVVPKRIVAISALSEGNYSVLFESASHPPTRVLWMQVGNAGRQVILNDPAAVHTREGADSSVAVDAAGQVLLSSSLKRSETVPPTVPIGLDDSLWRESAAGGLEWIRTGPVVLGDNPTSISAIGRPLFSPTGTVHWLAMLSPTASEPPAGFALMSGPQSNPHLLLSPESGNSGGRWLAAGDASSGTSGSLLGSIVLEQSQSGQLVSRGIKIEVDTLTGETTSITDVAAPGQILTGSFGSSVWNSVRGIRVAEDVCTPAGIVFASGVANGLGVLTKDGVILVQERDAVIDSDGSTSTTQFVAGAPHSTATNSTGDCAAAIPIREPNQPPKLGIFLNGRLAVSRGMIIEPGRTISHVYRELAVLDRNPSALATVLCRVRLTVPGQSITEDAVISWTGEAPDLDDCLADLDLSGSVDSDDVIIFFTSWDAGEPEADLDCSGGIDSDDILLFFQHFEAGC